MVKQYPFEIVPGRSGPIKLFLSAVCFLASTYWITGCAGQVPPSGGPPDAVPPEVVATSPVPGTLGFKGDAITLEFSEYVDRRSVEGSVFISPNLGTLTFDWGSTDVTISFPLTLRDSTTYVVTLGTDVLDLRNKNRMASSFSLAFSTGDWIDSAEISGRVYDPRPSGIMIFAYRHAGRLMDTLHPARTSPDAVTQTGKDGSFILPNLAYGKYRLIAVRDEFKDLFYDAETDQFGIPSREYLLTEDQRRLAGVQIRMSMEDTTRPFLSLVRGVDRLHAILRFNEPIDTSSLAPGAVALIDTVTGARLPVTGYAYITGAHGEVILETSPRESLSSYRVRVIGVRDLAKREIQDAAEESILSGLAETDTTKPRVAVKTLRDTLVMPFPDDTILIRFSEPVMKEPAELGIELVDSGGAPLAWSGRWLNEGALTILPEKNLEYATDYRLRIAMDSIRDGGGLRAGDSTTVFKFRTIDRAILGGIQGTIRDLDSTGAGRFFVIARAISTRIAPPIIAVLDEPGSYEFALLPEGKYTLEAFRDSDGNGFYSSGSVFPYFTAERFAVFPETLKVRARWPLEGVNIVLR